MSGAEMSTMLDEETVLAADPRWAEAGITVRQLDYWTRAGYLCTASEQQPGSGNPRCWPLSELEVAVRVRRLLDAGFLLVAALEYARLGFGVHEVAAGVVLAVQEVPR